MGRHPGDTRAGARRPGVGYERDPPVSERADGKRQTKATSLAALGGVIFMRLDLFLKRCCLIRRRSEARRACDNGIVSVDGRPAKAGRLVRPGQRVCLAFTDRYVEVEILQLPNGNLSKAMARTCYRVIRDEAREGIEF